MQQIECLTVGPDVDWFTPGQIYKGFVDSDGQGFHTRDDDGEEAFIWLESSSHGTFRRVNF